jgi:hypothetical protein
MKPTSAATLSGCLVWVIVFGALSACILPMAMIAGGFSSASNFAMQTLEPFICPDGTTAQRYSYPTTTTDEFGNTQPSTAYELHCVDTNGTLVKKDPVLYAFAWVGIMTMIGLGLAALLALALAAPARLFLARIFDRRQTSNITDLIEPA